MKIILWLTYIRFRLSAKTLFDVSLRQRMRRQYCSLQNLPCQKRMDYCVHCVYPFYSQCVWLKTLFQVTKNNAHWKEIFTCTLVKFANTNYWFLSCPWNFQKSCKHSKSRIRHIYTFSGMRRIEIQNVTFNVLVISKRCYLLFIFSVEILHSITAGQRWVFLYNIIIRLT